MPLWANPMCVDHTRSNLLPWYWIPQLNPCFQSVACSICDMHLCLLEYMYPAYWLSWRVHLCLTTIGDAVNLPVCVLQLSTVTNLTIYGPNPCRGRAALCSFNVDGLHATDISTLLDQEGDGTHLLLHAGLCMVARVPCMLHLAMLDTLCITAQW